jgi:hypothetical protein
LAGEPEASVGAPGERSVRLMGSGVRRSGSQPLSRAVVRIGGRTVPLSAVRNDPARFTQLLSRARAEAGHAYCLCTDTPLRLVIRVRDGRYHLAGWPGEGDRHAPHCMFHKTAAAMSGRSHYARSAIEETEDGTAIRLGTPLTTKAAAARRPAAAPRPAGSSGEQRRSVGLLGLLHYLWEQSQLTVWHPSWRRSWHTCHARLVQQVGDCTLNRHQLSDTLYIVPPYRQDTADRTAQQFDTFTRRLGRHRTGHRRGLLLGELKDTSTTPHGIRIALRHQRGFLFASTALMDRLKRSYRPAFSDAAAQLGAAARRIGLFLVDRSKAGYLTVEDAAVMLTNATYIPADSTHEVRMADALAEAGRSFSKPVRYDVAACRW